MNVHIEVAPVIVPSQSVQCSISQADNWDSSQNDHAMFAIGCFA